MSPSRNLTSEEVEALSSVTRAEEFLWGWTVRRQIQNPGSRYARNVGAMGVEGAARLMYAFRDMAPAGIVLLIIWFGSQFSETVRSLIPLWVCLAAVLLGAGLLRTATVAASQKRYKASRSDQSSAHPTGAPR